MKYWAYVNNEILGPFEKEKLFEIPDFSPSTLLCPQSPAGESTQDWQEAASFPEIAAMLNSPSMPASGGKGETKPKTADPGNGKESEAGKPKEKSEPPKEAKIQPSQEQAPKDEKGAGKLEPKPLSPTPLTPSAANPPAPASADNFSVNQLRPLKEEEEKKESPGVSPPQENAEAIEKEPPAPFPQTPQEEPAASYSSSFDPLSLSQIRKKSEGISEKREPPAEEIPKKSESEEIKPPDQVETVAKTETETKQETAFQPSPDISREIAKQMENLQKTFVTKSDLSASVGPINEKLVEISGAVNRSDTSKIDAKIKEISEKLQVLENLIEEIKLNLSIKQENAPSQKPETQQPMPAMADIGQTQRAAASLETQTSQAKQEENKAETQKSGQPAE